MISVEVAYATSTEQRCVGLQVVVPCTVEQAIYLSELLAHFTEIDLASNAVGIFGRRVTLDALLQDGDRVEIYRPLLLDPKQARRRRAV